MRYSINGRRWTMTETRPPRVLVIDDANLVRMYYRETLEARGFEVEVAFNGLEGLEKVAAAPFDLLVVDVNMPRMDGLTFVRALRRSAPSVATIPVLVSSTESGEQDKQAAR